METRTSPHLAIQVECINKQSYTAPFNSGSGGGGNSSKKMLDS